MTDPQTSAQRQDEPLDNARALVAGLPQQPATARLRQTGEAVGAVLAGWQAGPALQAAGILQALICGEILTEADVAEACGPRVAMLCRQYHCLLRDEASAQEVGPGRPEGQSREKWRGNRLVLRRVLAFQAAYQDQELGFLHAAVLWQRFETIRAAGPLHHSQYGDEGRLLLGPFLEMLGMRGLRAELDGWLAAGGRATATDTGADDQVFRPLLHELSARLPGAALRIAKNTQTHNLSTSMTGAPAMHTQQTPVIDILTDDDAACYRALYWVHKLYAPVEGGLVDNIGDARVNGYRCISATVMAPLEGTGDGATDESKRTRITFRMATHTMDEVNRWGLAAYVLRTRLPGPPPQGWWTNAEAGLAALQSAPMGSLPETISVFSPHGQLFHFHRGSTVVDYAYQVHSDLADQCSRFFVNGETVEPATVLHHMDLVELEHDPHAPGPTQVWLDAAHTNRARSKIERFLKRHGQGVYQGQRIIDQRLKALEAHYGFSIPDYRVQQTIAQAMRRLKVTRTEELFMAVATGRWEAERMLHPLFAEEVIRQVSLPPDLRLRPNQIQLAQCCRPRAGDDVVGRPYRRHGAITRLKLHRSDCPRIAGQLRDGDAYIPIKWRLQPRLNAVAQLEMSALNEDGLLGDVLEEIYHVVPRITLHRVEANVHQGIATIRLTMDAEGKEVLDEIVDGLRRLPKRNIDRVRLMDLSLSEQEAILSTGAGSRQNPYSRLPVHQREMFFGRNRDLTRLTEWLQADAGSIWLRGQKRVGKTSLLLHLQRHYLQQQGFIPVYVDFQLLGNMDGANIFFEVASAIHNDLLSSSDRGDLRMADLGAPLRELFEHDPRLQLIAYLRSIRSRLGKRRLVLLLDEFSRTVDAAQQDVLDPSFFVQWRGLMLATMPAVSFVTVVQQKTYDRLSAGPHRREEEPIWELLELGEQMVLRPLNDDDVRRLIEWPIRNFLEYQPAVVSYVAQLTGGSPFLIQAFCFKLVNHMMRNDRRQVTWDDVEAVRMEFMQPHESLFAHIQDLIRGIGHTVVAEMAVLADENQEGVIHWQALLAALPNVDSGTLHRTIDEFVAGDILQEMGTDRWRFANLLFQQWLLLNPLA